LDADTIQVLFRDFPHPVNGADWQRAKELHFVALSNERETIWLPKIAGDFSEQFVRSDADAGTKAALESDPLFEVASDRNRSIEPLISVLGWTLLLNNGSKVEVRFIDGHLFDDRITFTNDPHNLARFIAISVHAGTHK